jgi:CheY-like chemotaxis protein
METVSILLVEDDKIDLQEAMRAFTRARVANPVHVARDGIEALEILRGTGGQPPLPRPYLILLDLNMPRMNGVEFLTALRSDPELKDSIVFVLTTSKADHDRMAAYEKNVAGYIVKTELEDGFLCAITMLKCYWRVVQLPIGSRLAFWRNQ